MDNEHTDGSETQTPIPKPPMLRSGGMLMFTVALLGTGWWVFAYSHVPYVKAEQTVKPVPAETKTDVLPMEVAVHQVRPIGLDRSACVRLPYDGSTTCKADDVGQKIVKVSGQYRRITCGNCLRFIYPKDIQTTVEFTENGGVR